MLWVKTGTHIIDHERLLAAGAVARDLYQWGMLYAGKHETDGELPMVAVLASSWGYGGKANIKAAVKLVEVGLWLRTTHGFSICRWAEQGNQTKAQITADRESAKVRASKVRSEKVRANEQRTHAIVPTSTSLSTSGSDPSQIASWWDGACDAAAMSLGGTVVDRPARWAEYASSRDRKGWAKNHGDAVGWLSAVLRSERERASSRPAARGAEITKQPYDPDAPWLKLPEVG